MRKVCSALVAGALMLSGTAFAQSGVTISGVLKMSVDNIRLGQTAKTPSSETRMTDNASEIAFSMREDLGGGLQAIGRVGVQVVPDTGAISATGNSHVGLRSKTWGRLFIGRQNLHYFNTESELTIKGSLKGQSVALLAFAGRGTIPIGTATRTPNVIHYTTPDWGGFTTILAYSTNPNGVEADIGSGVRKGRAWHLNPNFRGSNFQVGYSYWNSKPDGIATVATSPVIPPNIDQRGDRLYGSYRWGGFKIGAAWDKSKVTNQTALTIFGIAAPANTTLSDRTAWSTSAQYVTGPHGFFAHYTKARNDKAPSASGLDTQASMWAMAYAYDLSKRTSVSVTYAAIKNGAAAAYNLFSSSAGGGGTGAAAFAGAGATFGGGTGAGATAGEDPRIISATIRQTF